MGEATKIDDSVGKLGHSLEGFKFIFSHGRYKTILGSSQEFEVAGFFLWMLACSLQLIDSIEVA